MSNNNNNKKENVLFFLFWLSIAVYMFFMWPGYFWFYIDQLV